jgi:hypothetical protein
MKPINIVDASRWTEKIFGGELPEAIVSGLGGLKSNMNSISKIAKASRTVVLGGAIGTDTEEVFQRLMAGGFIFLPGSKEYLALQLYDAMERNDQEDILFFSRSIGSITLGTSADQDSEIDAIQSMVSKYITKDIVKWIEGFPPILIFNNFSDDCTKWVGNKTVAVSGCTLVSTGASLGTDILFTPDAVELESMNISGSWLPYLLHPDRIKKEVVRMQHGMSGANPLLMVHPTVTGFSSVIGPVTGILSAITMITWGGVGSYHHVT